MGQTKYLLITLSVILVSAEAGAQRVKRKGVTPIDVTKNKVQQNQPAYHFSLEQLTGKWQEVKRERKEDTSKLRVIDTILLNFTEPGKVITKEGNGMNIIGDAVIDKPGNLLLAAADVYTIVSVSENELVLDDQEYYFHTFKKVEQFTFETLGKLKVEQESFTQPVAVKIADIMGKWSVYRKQAKPGAIKPSDRLIKSIYALEKISESSARGEINFYQSDKSESLPCTIKLNGTSIEIMAEDNIWLLKTYKGDGKEFVFGDAGGLLYYAKPI